MKGRRHHLFSGPALSLDQNWNIDIREFADRLKHFLHGFVASDHAAKSPAVLQSFTQMHYLGHIPKYDQRAHLLVRRRGDRYHGHLQVPPLSLLIHIWAHVSQLGFSRILGALAKRTIPAAKAGWKHFMAV